jgi:hypothetical protein
MSLLDLGQLPQQVANGERPAGVEARHVLLETLLGLRARGEAKGPAAVVRWMLARGIAIRQASGLDFVANEGPDGVPRQQLPPARAIGRPLPWLSA